MLTANICGSATIMRSFLAMVCINRIFGFDDINYKKDNYYNYYIITII